MPGNLPVNDTVASSLSAFIELFEIDCTTIPGMSNIFYFTPMVNVANTALGEIVWNNNAYVPFPINISGTDFSAEDAPARPKLDISNINNSRTFGILSFQYGSIIGAKVTYIRTFAQYIGGIGAISAPPLKYIIRKKVAHNAGMLSFELGSTIDKERAKLPKRQMLKADFPGLGLNKVFS